MRTEEFVLSPRAVEGKKKVPEGVRGRDSDGKAEELSFLLA